MVKLKRIDPVHLLHEIKLIKIFVNLLIRYTTVLIIFFLADIKAISQISIPYNGYNHARAIYNPAYSSHVESFNIHASYQNYFIGFENAPEALNFNLFGSLNNKMGININVHRTNIHIFHQTRVEGGYSYRIKLTDNAFLAFGLSAGLNQSGASQSDNPMDQYEPVLERNYFNKKVINTGFGLSLKYKDLALDIAAPDLYYDSRVLNRYIMTASYNYRGIERFTFTPLFMYRDFSRVKNDYHVKMQVEYLSQIYIEFGYGNDIHLMAGAGITFNEIKFGYSYCTLPPSFSSISRGTNSLFLIYSFRKKEQQARYNIPQH